MIRSTLHAQHPRSAHAAMAWGLMVAAGLAALGTAQAAPATRFEPAAQVADSALLLNGAGTRYRAVFKAYDLALYLPRKAGTPEAVIAMPGAKRLYFTALRDLPGTDLGLAFVKGLQANATADQVQRHMTSATRLIEIFSGKAKLVAGDTFAMDYLPGRGTQFFIKGEPQGAPVGDAEFFQMVLRIWLGSSPVDAQLKDALLGQEPRAAHVSPGL